MQSRSLSCRALYENLDRARKPAVKFRNLARDERRFANFVCLFHFEGQRPAKFSLKPVVAKSFSRAETRESRGTCHREICKILGVITLVRQLIYARTRGNSFRETPSPSPLPLSPPYYLRISKIPPNSVCPSRRNVAPSFQLKNRTLFSDRNSARAPVAQSGKGWGRKKNKARLILTLKCITI